MSVVQLATTRTVANQSTIEKLEEMLELARDGKIICVAVACEAPDGSSWTSHSDLNSAQLMLGALDILKAKILKQIVD
jgi:hypothetical protein